MASKYSLLAYYVLKAREHKRHIDRFAEYIAKCDFRYLLRYELFRLQTGLLDDLVDEMIARGLWK